MKFLNCLLMGLAVFSGAALAQPNDPVAIPGAWIANPLDACKSQIPLGEIGTGGNYPVICNGGYILAYDTNRKNPVYVSWVLSRFHALGCLPRKNAFHKEPQLSVLNGSRIVGNLGASPEDYTNTHLDRGHIANDDDFSYDEQAQFLSFSMANMTMQKHGFNAGIWKSLEVLEREWTMGPQNAEGPNGIQIIAGPIFDGVPEVKNGVAVATRFYKALINLGYVPPGYSRTLAFIFPHTVEHGPLPMYLVSIDAVERAAHISIPVPPDTDKFLTAPQLWPGKAGEYARIKKQACHGQ